MSITSIDGIETRCHLSVISVLPVPASKSTSLMHVSEFFFSCWVTNMKLRIISVIIGFSLSGSQYFFIGIVYYVNMQLLNVNSNQSYIEINKQNWTKALDIADRCGFRETVIRTIGMSFRVSCHEMDRYTQIEKKEEKVCMNVASCSRFHSKKRTCTSKWWNQLFFIWRTRARQRILKSIAEWIAELFIASYGDVGDDDDDN